MSGAAWRPPAKIEALYASQQGNAFASVNAPTAGPRKQQPLPQGSAPLQLYSLATPNGQKISILLEELGVAYDAWPITIAAGEQFTSGFVELNPNSKIPALRDLEGPDNKPLNLFESGAIMLYLAEKFGRFIPRDPRKRAECLCWVFWQVGGQGPMTGNFGHFMVYAPENKHEARDYGVARYGMEVQRLCSVLDRHLSDGRQFIVGEEYTIADMICVTWINTLRRFYEHPSGIGAREFLSIDCYKYINAWADRLFERPAVRRGMRVCSNGVGKPWLTEAAKL